MTSLSVRCYQLHPSEFAHLFSPQLTYLIALFHERDYSIRVIGGAVRDLLLGTTPHDIDLATTATTDDIMKIIEGNSNIELVYTRAEQFGTLTLIVGTTVRTTFQVTTLKRSITRHGRDVLVAFTNDWNTDAQLRDLSINSLSIDDHGLVYDYTNGVDDLKRNRVRFNGNTLARIQENPIRILRYFRFFGRLSPAPCAHESQVLDAIRQGAMALQGIEYLDPMTTLHIAVDVPGEKIWIELKLILTGRFAGHLMRTILEQRLAPVLGLPDSSAEMFELENRWLRCMNHQPEPMTLLVTLFDDQSEFDTFCKRVKCSSYEKNLGQFLLNCRYSLQPSDNDDLLRPYQDFLIDSHLAPQDILHQYVIELLKYQGHIHLVDDMKQWSVPKFPVNTWDLRENGLTSAHRFSHHLRQLRQQWRSNEFQMSKQELIEYGFQSGLFYT